MDTFNLITEWKKEADADRLLTWKHDPNNMTYSPDKTRTVVSYQVSSSLKDLIHSEDYEIEKYYDVNHPDEGGFYILKPSPSVGFKYLGHVIEAGSFDLKGSLDRLLIVSGSSQGWHIAAEDSENIDRRVNEGTLFLVGGH